MLCECALKVCVLCECAVCFARGGVNDTVMCAHVSTGEHGAVVQWRGRGLQGKVLFEKDGEEPTDLEKRALKAGRKQARKEGKLEAMAALPKRNVRKRR